ncbi:MAG: UDP-N-acetylglucosamine 1-carboxyvinyltransferase [Patescibacteria group bacterium]|jgi:UDP-N-acetylglucosamine 1-carboxyvinyltransferase
MSRYIVNGGKTLNGEISIRGAKNASFKQIIASMLSGKPTLLTNVPKISDVNITTSIAAKLGAQVNHTGEHSLEISTPTVDSYIVPKGTGQKSRTSFMFAAPLLARCGQAIVPFPGGDRLGDRPLDRLFDCLHQMNISINIENDLVHFQTDAIKPTHYTFLKPSHTVTETILMLACVANGETVLENSALEPEIDDLIDMLNSMGGQIERDKNDPKKIIIQGVPWLNGTKHQVISDRNESVTFACAALATKGSINILRINPAIIQTFLETIQKMGAKIDTGKDEVTVSWVQPLKAINIETTPEPGFMTDWQAVFSVLLTQAIGCSTIIERIFPSRFQHISYLKQMGVKTSFFNPANIDSDYYFFNPESDKPEYFHGVKIYGPAKLQPGNLVVSDLRAGASVTLAALIAPGQTVIDGVEYIERGYEKLAERLNSLGAGIEYIKKSLVRPV